MYIFKNKYLYVYIFMLRATVIGGATGAVALGPTLEGAPRRTERGGGGIYTVYTVYTAM